MKKSLFLAVVLLLSSFVGISAKDWAFFSRYADENAVVEKLPESQRRVVMMGNSITKMWAETDTAFFVDNGFISRGVSGQVTAQMLLRFRADVIELHPKVVVILGGTNDIAGNDGPYDEDTTFGNIVSMVELAEANGIVPVLSSVLPVVEYPWNKTVTDVPEKVRSLNRKICEYAGKKNILYVDYYQQMQRDGALIPEYTFDGVHPTAAGYEVMESLLIPALQELLR